MTARVDPRREGRPITSSRLDPSPRGFRVHAELRRFTSGPEAVGKLMKKTLRHYCFQAGGRAEMFCH